MKGTMQFLLNFFGKRRFNYIDTFSFFLFAWLWGEGQYLAANVAFVALLLVSFMVESHAER